jgi:hypothetical protein
MAKLKQKLVEYMVNTYPKIFENKEICELAIQQDKIAEEFVCKY